MNSRMIIILLPLIVITYFFFKIVPTIVSYLRTQEKSIKVEGTTRYYRVHTPKIINKNTSLLIIFHGRGMSNKIMELYTGISNKSDSENAIIVYPQGTADENGNLRSWNARFCCEPALSLGINDIQFTQDLIQKMKTMYSFDTNRIFLTGFSNGGMFTYVAAQEIRGIRAIAVISGTINGTVYEDKPYQVLSEPVNKLTILIFHGRDDKVVPFNGGRGKYDYSNFASVQDAIDYWSKYNSVLKKPVKEIVSPSVSKITYGFEEDRSIVLFNIDHKGHSWPGNILQQLKNIFGVSLSANDEMWKFFDHIK